MEQFEYFDDEKFREYINNIRNEIYKGLEDLRKRNDSFYNDLFEREKELFYIIKNNFILNCKDISEEEKKRLINLIEIYSCLNGLSISKYYIKNDVNRLNSLVNKE